MSSAPPTANEPTSPERIKLVREFFVQLRKAAKNIGMYRHQESRFPALLLPAFQALEVVLKDGPLVLKVSAEAFLFGQEPVWEADGNDNAPGRFFREGVRHLILRPEFTEAELTQLVLIMLSNSDRGGLDIVEQLFNASFEHLEHVVVDGFTVGELSEEQVEVEVDKIVEYLYGRLRSDSDDTLAYARVTAADLELKLNDVEQIRGVLIEGNEVSPAYKLRVQEELQKDDSTRLHQQLATLVFAQLRACTKGSIDAAAGSLLQVIDGLLLQEDLTPLAKLLDALKALAEQGGPGSPAAEARGRLSKALGEGHRIRRLGEALELNPALDLGGAARYLAELEPGGVGPLLDVLERLVQPERRALLVDALAVIGKDQPQFFAARLDSEKSQTVRDMIAIVEKAGFPDRARYIQQAMHNPNPAVRIEVLGILANSPSPESAHRFVLEATTDKSPLVRAAAFNALTTLSPLRASQDLLRLPKLPDWEKRPEAEKQLIYRCLGQTGTPDAVRHLVTLLQQKRSLFGGRRVTETKLLAVEALQAMGDVQAFKLLQAATADAEPEVATAARKAMLQVKRAFSETARQATTQRTEEARRDGLEADDAEATAEAAQELFTDFVAARARSEEESAELKRRVAAAREEEERQLLARQQADRERLERVAARKAAQAAGWSGAGTGGADGSDGEQDVDIDIEVGDE